MSKHANPERIPLPRSWPRRVTSAMLHVIAMAQHAAACTRGWAANARLARVRLKAENDQLRQEAALPIEKIRIKDARMQRIDPQRRPHYVPTPCGSRLVCAVDRRRLPGHGRDDCILDETR